MHLGQNSPDASRLTLETLPAIGYIAWNDELEPLAAGFLRRVEGGYAQIDTLVSNERMTSAQRHKALSSIVEQLIKTAKELNLLGIVSYTQDKSIILRAEAIGFQLVPSYVISLSLKD